jgi:hypothetical protein
MEYKHLLTASAIACLLTYWLTLVEQKELFAHRVHA